MFRRLGPVPDFLFDLPRDRGQQAFPERCTGARPLVLFFRAYHTYCAGGGPAVSGSGHDLPGSAQPAIGPSSVSPLDISDLVICFRDRRDRLPDVVSSIRSLTRHRQSWFSLVF